MARAICKQLKRNGQHRFLVLHLRQNDEGLSQLPDSLNLRLAVDSCIWPKRPGEQVTSAKANSNTSCVVYGADVYVMSRPNLRFQKSSTA
jgi:hypothetical protein